MAQPGFKVALQLAATYVGYCCAWFVLVIASALYSEVSPSEAKLGFFGALLGTLVLVAISGVLARRWIWRTAPAGAVRIVTLIAFALLLLCTAVLQALFTLLLFNR